MVAMNTTQKHEQCITIGLLVCRIAEDMKVGDGTAKTKKKAPWGESRVTVGNLFVILLLGLAHSLLGKAEFTPSSWTLRSNWTWDISSPKCSMYNDLGHMQIKPLKFALYSSLDLLPKNFVKENAGS